MKQSKGIVGMSSLVGLVILAVALPFLNNIIKKPQDTRNRAVEDVKCGTVTVGNKYCISEKTTGEYAICGKDGKAETPSQNCNTDMKCINTSTTGGIKCRCIINGTEVSWGNKLCVGDKIAECSASTTPKDCAPGTKCLVKDGVSYCGGSTGPEKEACPTGKTAGDRFCVKDGEKGGAWKQCDSEGKYIGLKGTCASDLKCSGGYCSELGCTKDTDCPSGKTCKDTKCVDSTECKDKSGSIVRGDQAYCCTPGGKAPYCAGEEGTWKVCGDDTFRKCPADRPECKYGRTGAGAECIEESEPCGERLYGPCCEGFECNMTKGLVCDKIKNQCVHYELPPEKEDCKKAIVGTKYCTSKTKWKVCGGIETGSCTLMMECSDIDGGGIKCACKDDKKDDVSWGGKWCVGDLIVECSSDLTPKKCSEGSMCLGDSGKAYCGRATPEKEKCPDVKYAGKSFCVDDKGSVVDGGSIIKKWKKCDDKGEYISLNGSCTGDLVCKGGDCVPLDKPEPPKTNDCKTDGGSTVANGDRACKNNNLSGICADGKWTETVDCPAGCAYYGGKGTCVCKDWRGGAVSSGALGCTAEKESSKCSYKDTQKGIPVYEWTGKLPCNDICVRGFCGCISEDRKVFTLPGSSACTSDGKIHKCIEMGWTYPYPCPDDKSVCITISKKEDLKNEGAKCVSKDGGEKSASVPACYGEVKGSCRIPEVSTCAKNLGRAYTGGGDVVGADYNCDGVINVADYSVWRKESFEMVPWNGVDYWTDVEGSGFIGGDGFSRWRGEFLR